MSITETTKALLSVPGISGFEGDIAELACEKLSRYCSDARVTKTKSVVGTLMAKDPKAPTVMLEAHLDRIGLIVKAVDDAGFVEFTTLGGVDVRILPAAEVRILGKEEVYGVIGAKPPHITSKSEASAAVSVENLLIDTGLGEAARDKISVGDPILLDFRFRELLNGRISSAALDNRLSMAAIFEVLEKLKGRDLPVNLAVGFTSGEEMGLQGAYTLSSEIQPDLAVVLDVTYGRTPDCEDEGTFPLGSGVAILRGPNVHYEITKKTIAVAKAKGISYEIEVAPRSSGTTAWALQNSGNGIPCIILSIPLRYMHTTVETVDLYDVDCVCRLIEEIICGGEVIA